jgi:hypothetical protein
MNGFSSAQPSSSRAAFEPEAVYEADAAPHLAGVPLNNCKLEVVMRRIALQHSISDRHIGCQRAGDNLAGDYLYDAHMRRTANREICGREAARDIHSA